MGCTGSDPTKRKSSADGSPEGSSSAVGTIVTPCPEAPTTFRLTSIGAPNNQGGIDTRPGRRTNLEGSVVEEMARLVEEQGAQAVGVMVIDMQRVDVGTEQHVPGRGTVAANQAAVLQAANGLGLTVFHIRIVRVGYAHGNTNDPSIAEVVDNLPAADSGRLVSIDKPYYNSFQGTALAEELAGRSGGVQVRPAITTMIVMGFDANTCVKNTIFGTPAADEYTADGKVHRAYLNGLLDRDIQVITSRLVLASGASTLDGHYTS